MIRDVLEQLNYETLFDMGLEVAISFFIGGLLLAVISTPVCYYVIRRIVIKYRLLREKARAKKSAEGRK